MSLIESKWRDSTKFKGKEGEGDISLRGLGCLICGGSNQTYECPKRRKLKCFICDGSHQAYEYSKKGKLKTLKASDEEERDEEEQRIASLHLLYDNHAQVENKSHGSLYVEIEIGGKQVPTIVDQGTNIVHITEEGLDDGDWGSGGDELSEVVEGVPMEFGYTIPSKLPRVLPSPREVDPKVELESGVKSPIFGPYPMTSSRLEVSRR